MAKSRIILDINDIAKAAKKDINALDRLWLMFLPHVKKNISYNYNRFKEFIGSDYNTFFDDLYSESFIIFHKHLFRWEPGKLDFLGYWKLIYPLELKIVMRDAYLKSWRIKIEILNKFSDVFEVVDSFDDVVELYDSIESLCPLFKRLIISYYFKGFTQKEIAEKENIGIGAVNGKLKKARKELYLILK